MADTDAIPEFSKAKPGSGDLRQQLAMLLEDEEPRSIVTRLFNSALALLIVVMSPASSSNQSSRSDNVLR